MRPYAPGAAARPNGDGGDIEVEAWRGVPAERRWAMEVLGVRAGARVDREEVQRRFRRLLRLAHPDHGAADIGAAERIAELAEARELLLAVLDHERELSAAWRSHPFTSPSPAPPARSGTRSSIAPPTATSSVPTSRASCG